MATQSLEFKSDLDDSQFQAGLKNMEKGGKRVEGSLVGSFDSMAKGIGASMAAAFTVGAVVNAGKAVIDFAGQLQDQAEALGINTEVLQGFQGAMADSGVSAEKFTKGMATLISSIQQAKEDSGTARDSFAALGIEFDSIANDSPDQILLKIADGLKNAKDPAAAYAAALDLVGKNQINFVAALKGGSADFQESASKIKTASEEQVAAVARIGDAWDKATTAAKTYGIEVLDVLANPAGALQRQNEVENIQNAEDMRKVAAGDTRKLDAMKKHEELGKGNLQTNSRELVAQKKLLEEMGVNTLSTNYKNHFDNLKKAAEHAERQKAKLGQDYKDPTMQDPKKQVAPLKPYSGMEDLIGKKANDERNTMLRKLEAQSVTDKQKQEESLRKANEEYAANEAATQKMADEDQEAKRKAKEKKDKEAAKEALQDKIKQAGQTLEQAQKVTAKAEQKTEDARSSLQRALEGNPDADETFKERQVRKMMDKLENPAEAKQTLKIGKVGGGTALDEARKVTSTMPGVAKALKKLMEAKERENAAKKAEDLIKKQQEEMVTALKAINKGINGV